MIPFTVAAMYHLQQIGDPSVFSPSGRQIAFVIKRPLETDRNVARAFLQDDDVADVYIADLQDGRVTKVTDGAADGSGFWAPQWSPDGRRIAMLSTRGGNVFLWVWDAAGGLRRVTDRAVDMGYQLSNFQWLSDERIVSIVLPQGKEPLSMSVETQTPEIAMHAWPVDWRGRRATVNVLQSGVAADVATRPQERLQVIDLSGGKTSTQVLAHAANFDSLTLSRDRRYVAVFAEVGILEPRAGRKFQSSFDDGIYTLFVYDARTGKRIAHFERRDVGASPLSWSDDDADIAVLGEPATTAFKSHLQTYRCVLETGDCANVLPRSLTVDSGPNGTKSAPLWSRDGHLLVYAAGAALKNQRWDWYSIGRSGTFSNATASLTSPPASLIPIGGGTRFVGASNGKLFTVFADGRAPQQVRLAGEPRISAIVWPTSGRAGKELVVASDPSGQEFFVINAVSGSVTHLARVPQAAELNAFDPANASAVFAESLRSGSFLRYTRAGAPLQTLYATNTWLERYAEARCVPYSYTSLDKQNLNAWILLPPNYRAGRRYPAVIWVYAGSVMSPRKTPYLAQLNLVHALNLQLLAARGYAVIFPSMPLPPLGHPTDPYPMLPNGVLPAIEKAVKLGYIDGNRVAVMGQSYGGFSTYALITQTDRFKAAIALAGISDWASLYGTYDGRQRYSDNVNVDDEFNEQLLEDGQGNFGAPPWVNPDRYRLNSPITYVAKVHTPLLIIQGDLDYVAIQQGEQFFTALYRQGKRAEFARYWGEEHVFRSEANIADCWARIGRWLDEFLR